MSIDDTVKALRAISQDYENGNDGTSFDVCGECKNAADQLERLNNFQNSQCMKLMEKIAVLESENERLKSENEWTVFTLEYDEEEKMDMLQCKLPDDEERILVTDGKTTWEDTFMRDYSECYLDSGYAFIDDVLAWRPMPKYVGETTIENGVMQNE